MDFLIFNEEAKSPDDFTIVSAPDDGAARRVYGQQFGIKDRWFKEDVYGRTYNWSFGARFANVDGVYFFNEETGDPLYTEAEMKDAFERNVRAYFANQPEHAERYLDFWNDSADLSEAEAETKWSFPDSMLMTMYLSGYGQDIAVVPLSQIKRIAHKDEA